MTILAVTSAMILARVLFKPGTPKTMRDRDLDARKRIIAERLGRILAAVPASSRQDAKALALLYSEQNGY
jgi:hypothetical protein